MEITQVVRASPSLSLQDFNLSNATPALSSKSHISEEV